MSAYELALSLYRLGLRLAERDLVGIDEADLTVIAGLVDFLDQAVADVEVVTEAERVLRGDRS